MSALQDIQTQKSYKYLEEVELLAQDILTAKETKIQVANSQNKFREALRALESVEDRKTWVKLGNVYVERSTTDCKTILKDEIHKATEDLDTLHNEIKSKVQKLRDIEHEPRLEGFTLKPISVAEAKGLHKAFGRTLSATNTYNYKRENHLSVIMCSNTKVAAGFVIFRKVCGKVEYLLLQTSYGIHHWTPPKGHVDPGETEFSTALRETQEECGLVKNDLKIFEDIKKVLHYKVKGKPKIVHYWLAEVKDPNCEIKLSDEHQDFKWLDVKEACKYANYKDMQEVLVDFEKYIKTDLAN